MARFKPITNEDKENLRKEKMQKERDRGTGPHKITSGKRFNIPATQEAWEAATEIVEREGHLSETVRELISLRRNLVLIGLEEEAERLDIIREVVNDALRIADDIRKQQERSKEREFKRSRPKKRWESQNLPEAD